VNNGELIAKDRVQIQDFTHKAEAILQQATDYKMTLEDFIAAMNEKWDAKLETETIEKDSSDIILITPEDESGTRYVTLTSLRLFAHDMKQLLECRGGFIPLLSLEQEYLHK